MSALVSVGEDAANKARAMSATDSLADSFARSIASLWKAGESAGEPASGVAAGTVNWEADGARVCFPSMPALALHCALFADFEFSESERITRFSVDGQALERVYQPPSREDLTMGKDASFVAQDWGRIRSTNSDSWTVILWLNQPRGENTSRDFSLSRIRVENADEEEVEILAQSIPQVVGYWQGQYAALLLPEDAKFVFMCWTPDEECDWVSL